MAGILLWIIVLIFCWPIALAVGLIWLAFMALRLTITVVIWSIALIVGIIQGARSERI